MKNADFALCTVALQQSTATRQLGWPSCCVTVNFYPKLRETISATSRDSPA
jgi:hypothetical protein